MADAPPKSPLQSLLSGELFPIIPGPRLLAQDDGNELYHYLEKLQDYIRRLLGALTSINIYNEIITNPPSPLPPGTTITVMTDWQYDSANHKFQVKTRDITGMAVGTESGWTDVDSGGQPQAATHLTNWQYNVTSHQFEYKTQQVYVLSPGAESGYTATAGTQPSSQAVLSGWKYDAATHKFMQKTRSTYALEFAAESSYGNVPDGDQPVVVSRVVRDVNYSTSTHVLDEDIVADVYVLDKGADTNDINVDSAELGSCA